MTERITPEQIAHIRAEYRAVVANTTNGGSGEDFATLAAWLVPALNEIERLRARITDYRQAMENGTQAACAKTYDAMIAALAPPPAREEGATP